MAVDKVESLMFPGHFHVPGMETVLINEEGVVIDLIEMACPLIKYHRENPDSYPHVNLPGSNTQHIHRLLALTFLECPGNPAKMHVNHIDGIKANNSLSNLEWATPSENSIHAYKSGLRNDNRPVLSKDLRSGDVAEHHSLNECARHFGVNPNEIYIYLNSRDIAPFNSYYTLTYSGIDWKPLTKADIGRSRNGRPKPLLAVWSDGSKVLYESATQASIELGMTLALVTYYATGNHAVAGKEFSLHYAQDYKAGYDDALIVRKDRVKPTAPTRKPVPVVVENTLTGAKEWWDSVESFAMTVDSNKNAIQKSMGKNNGRWKHYVIRYQAK